MVADFSIQDAAFTGFGVVREHRRYLAVWAGVALVVSFVLNTVVLTIGGPAMMILQALNTSSSRNPATVIALFRQLTPLYLVLIPPSIVFNGVLLAAMNRSVLRPDDHRFAYLAFGPDELRQIGVLLLGFVVFVAIYLVLVVGLIVAGLLLSAATHAPPATWVFTALLVAFVLMIWLAVRLSLASAMTFERGRVTLFGAWTLTRGRFWAIFGTYVLVAALATVISLLTFLVILGIVAVATGGNLQAAFSPPDTRSLGAYFTVAHVLQLALGAGVSALMWPVVLTPPAAIFRQISVRENGLSNRGFT